METSTSFGKWLHSAALIVTAAVCPPLATAQPQSTIEEMIVRGRSYAELREQIRIRQDALFARFNEINSDDGFDIHCKMEPAYGSRILERRWRRVGVQRGANFRGSNRARAVDTLSYVPNVHARRGVWEGPQDRSRL